MRFFLRLIFPLLFFLPPSGCHTTSKVASQNFAFLYRHPDVQLNADFSVFHSSDDTSRLYYRISAADLLLTRLDGDVFVAHVQLSFRHMDAYENPVLIDSGSTVVTFKYRMPEGGPAPSKEEMLEGFVPFKTAKDQTILEIVISDLSRKQSRKFYREVDKLNSFSAQNFLVRSFISDWPLMRSTLSSTEEVSIQYRDPSVQTLHVQYFSDKFPLPPFPHMTDKIKPLNAEPDSVFSVNTGVDERIVFEKKGFYHLRADSTKMEGLTIFRFGEDYPRFTTVDELIESAVYLMTRKEYDHLLSRKDKKAGLDEFWLKLGSSTDRSKELIRKYYSRIQEANTYFTSYLEGWKTDRGMIYIIYGTPGIIYKNSSSETWIYGDGVSTSSVPFTFARVDNPFTDNDYSLNRSPFYETGWGTAIDVWRQGRVYNDY